MTEPPHGAGAIAGVSLTLILALGWPAAAAAKPLGERPSGRAQPIPAPIAQAPLAPDSAVTLEQRVEGEHSYLLASNRLPGPVEMEVSPRDAGNVVADPALPHRVVLPPRSSGPIVELHKADPSRDGGIRYAYGYMLGSPDARHREDAAYLPPIPPGSAFPISQGFFGRQTHQGEQNRHAVDIAMPKGTPIHAARGGTVLVVQDGAGESGDETPGLNGNHVRILHDDGTMAVYAHLAPGNRLVHPGDPVAAGQPIGYSGSAGHATGPHLHFVIQHNAGMHLESLPFRFVFPDGNLQEPEEGMVLEGGGLVRK